MTGVYTALAATPVIFFTARRFPITRQTWKTAVPIALAGACVYSALHTTLMWLSRLALYPAAGQGSYDYGDMLFRYPMEASNDLITYATITGFIYFIDRMAAARRAEIAASELQAKLAEAQLENLRLQLNPHFLFNTLNAISSVMYEDLAKADEMLTKLSDFLRIVLASNGVHQVALDEEIDVERKYVEIMTARLEQRLELRVNVEPGAASAIVPFMILQPLLENSIRHGTRGDRGALDIGIDVARRNGSTVICVSDDGTGFDAANASRGHGLALVNSRLDHMYGGAATFAIGRRDGGGTRSHADVSIQCVAGGGVLTLRVLLADDEAPARRKLARFLEEHSDVELVGQAANGIDAVDLIALTQPDVVFLDIHMPDLDGLGVAEAMLARERPPRIVFVTAHDRYAVKAFEVSALDYLLKPYDRERFERALERTRRTLETEPAPGAGLADMLAAVRKEERYARRLLVSNDGRSSFVPVGEIRRLESDGNNVTIHCRSGSYSLRSTLESLEARLDPEQFARVHRSHLINIDDIAEVNPWFHGDYKIKLRDGSELTWSRRYAAKRPDLLK